MERAVYGHAARYPSSAPAALMVPIRQQLRRQRQALTQPQTSQVRRRAVQVVGVLSGIAGNLSLDTGREDQAVTFFELGRLVGDLLLRDAEPATELLAEALASRDPGDAKGRALITLDLAASRVVPGEPHDACLVVESALAAVPGALVRPIVSRSLAVRADMARWDGTKAVVRLDALLAEITHGADRRE